VRPSGELVSSALACAKTIGSLSAYTTREDGATAWATSCTLFAVGNPVPMSRNCRMPASAARNRTTRPSHARFSRAEVRAIGVLASTFSAISRSAAKWFLPPRK
jgi:hypothetical protein